MNQTPLGLPGGFRRLRYLIKVVQKPASHRGKPGGDEEVL